MSINLQYKQKSAQEIASKVGEDTINMVNSYGFDKKAYASKVLSAHRTLQQSWMRLACYVIEQIANQEHYDARNEDAVLLARKLVKVDGFGSLPLV